MAKKEPLKISVTGNENIHLSKEDKKIITEYASQIETIKLFVDAVRKNPGEYLSSTGDEGAMNCIREILQNSIDEMTRKISPCNKVWIEFDETTQRTTVLDNGRAIDPTVILRTFTQANTGTNFNKVKGEYPSGLHGVGSKCVNAVSSKFVILSYILNHAYIMEFKEGKPLYSKPKEVKNNSWHGYLNSIANPINGWQGLLVSFEFDYSIMGEVTITCNDVLNLVQNIVPLTYIGAAVEFIGYKRDGTVMHQLVENKDGVLDFLNRRISKPLIAPIVYSYDTGIMKSEIAFTYDISSMNSSTPDILAFANMTPVNSQLSTNSIGFIKGICSYFKDYMNKIYLVGNKKKIDIINADVTSGLKAAVSSAHMKVMFDGQAKNVCKNQDLIPFVSDLTYGTIQRWSKEHPDQFQKICEYLKNVSIARNKADNAKISISKNYKTSAINGLPEKFLKAENKKHLELFIVEGLSALAPCQSGREYQYQAIFPIKGKLPNAMNTPKAKFLANDEISGILHILGAGYGKNFNIEKCQYDKIIIMTDADYDGYDIRNLVLKFLLLYCKPLVEQGRVYSAVPPLYRLSTNGKWTYFTDKMQYTKYIQSQFSKNFEIKYPNGKPYTSSQIISIIINNEKYYELMFNISSTYMIDTILLETIILCKNLPFEKFKKTIKSKYRGMNVEKLKSGPILIEGDVGENAQTVILTKELMNSFSPLLPYLEKSDKQYILNGKRVGLYQLMSIFKSYQPKGLFRDKGLGSMKAIELRESTLLKENRKLLKYTVVDIEKEIQEIRKINDDYFSLLKDIDISEFDF